MTWGPIRVLTHSGNHVEIAYCFFLYSEVARPKFLIMMSRDIRNMGCGDRAHRGIPFFWYAAAIAHIAGWASWAARHTKNGMARLQPPRHPIFQTMPRFMPNFTSRDPDPGIQILGSGSGRPGSGSRDPAPGPGLIIMMIMMMGAQTGVSGRHRLRF